MLLRLSFIITNNNLPYKFIDKFNISGNNFGSLQNSSQTSELTMVSKFLERIENVSWMMWSFKGLMKLTQRRILELLFWLPRNFPPWPRHNKPRSSGCWSTPWHPSSNNFSTQRSSISRQLSAKQEHLQQFHPIAQNTKMRQLFPWSRQ